MHSTDARTQKLLPDDNERQQNDIDYIKEQAKKRRKEKLKVILMQVDSSKPPKSQQEIDLEKELKRAEDQRKKDEIERERKQKLKEEQEFQHMEKIQEMQVTGGNVIKQLNSLFGGKK